MPYCDKIKARCGFEQGSEPCREGTAIGRACNVIATKEVEDGADQIPGRIQVRP
jgi:hypothetical protein